MDKTFEKVRKHELNKLDTKESKLESIVNELQMNLHDTTFLVWTCNGITS
jgi:hypothetical protein